ncbi:MAG TPA: helix-turn-helix transcriptional regulator [Methylomirabilota bacterium]|jgi:excisionase family DNA binding protein|nr:helix-turn-helix transcriptional regulator [Methylomirabilota bacterium]
MAHRLLTVQEAARHLRLNPRSVYLLAQRGAIPATRVTGKWLFPEHLLDEWLEASARQRERGARPAARAAHAAALFAAGSDDPALELLLDAFNGPGPPGAGPLLYTATVGSTAGLHAVGAGRADLAWAHLVDPDSGEYNLAHVPRYLTGRPAVVVNLFQRDLGLVVWKGNPRKLGGLGDLGRRGLRFVNRQPGSGTRHFVECGLARVGVAPTALEGYRDEVSTHWAVGLRILRGEADVGVATRSVAQALSLGFVPLTRERFDMVIPKDVFFRPAVQTLLEAVRAPRFRRRLDALGGYDASEAGRVRAETP